MSPKGVSLEPFPDRPDLMRLAVWRKRALTARHKQDRRTRESHLQEFPLYAPYGEVAVSEFAITCHFCGREFKALGTHIWMIHGLEAEDYRRELGIHVGVPLDSHDVTRRKVERGKADKSFRKRVGKLAHTPEARKKMSVTYRRHLKEGRSTNSAVEAAARGEMPKEFLDGSGGRRQAELWAEDGEWAARRREGYANLPRPAQVEHTCTICGDVYLFFRSSHRLTCLKDECRATIKRRTALVNRDKAEEALRVDPEKRARVTAQLVAAGRAYAIKRRMPHKCANPACSNIIPLVSPQTCSNECRQAVRRATVRRQKLERGIPLVRGCEVAGCEGAHVARGLCTKHYQRQVALA